LFERFPLGMRAHGGLEQQTEVEPSLSLKTQLLSAGLAACYRPLSVAAWAIDGCVGADAGVLRATGIGITAPDSANPALLNSTLGAMVWVLPDPHLHVGVAGEWALPLVVPRIWFVGPGPRRVVHEAGPALRARLTLRIVF
jgi:hypothetical protein